MKFGVYDIWHGEDSRKWIYSDDPIFQGMISRFFSWVEQHQNGYDGIIFATEDKKTSNTSAQQIYTIVTPQSPCVVVAKCKCGDYPRVKTNGGSYVHLVCRTCGYQNGPFLMNYLFDVIKKWNESDRDVQAQKAGAAAFDRMMKYCEDAKGTLSEDQPIPQSFFGKLFHKKPASNR